MEVSQEAAQNCTEISTNPSMKTDWLVTPEVEKGAEDILRTDACAGSVTNELERFNRSKQR